MSPTIITPDRDTIVPPENGPTIGAKPIQAETVVGPIRRRFRSSQAVWYILGIIEMLLFFRFFLKLIGANESAGFTRLINGASLPFAGAFENVVQPIQSGN